MSSATPSASTDRSAVLAHRAEKAAAKQAKKEAAAAKKQDKDKDKDKGDGAKLPAAAAAKKPAGPGAGAAAPAAATSAQPASAPAKPAHPAKSPKHSSATATSRSSTPTSTLIPGSAPSSAGKKTPLQYDDAKRVSKHIKQSIVPLTATSKQIPMFSHVPQYEHSVSPTLRIGFTAHEEVHPAVLRLGLQYQSGQILGCNARTAAMLQALQEFIADYSTPDSKVLSRDLQTRLKPLIRFLDECRPKSIAMGSAIRWLKMRISKVSPTLSDSEAKQLLQHEIEQYIQQRIVVADHRIVNYGSGLIADGDTILVYSYSYVVEQLLLHAHHQQHKQFTVVVADSRPKYEGKKLLRSLVLAGINCQYIMIHSVAHLMPTVSRCLIGAHACLSNGAVLSRTGSAVVAMLANQYNKPVHVAAETHKFTERVQLDSVGYNELADPDQLIETQQQASETAQLKLHEAAASAGTAKKEPANVLHDWRDMAHLKLLNLNYDLTPADFITSLITEVGVLPPTAVPVVLHEFNKQDEELVD